MEKKEEINKKIKALQEIFAEDLKNYPGINSEFHLTRFLTARDNNLKKTQEMIKNYFQYRKKYNYNEIKNKNISKFLEESKDLFYWQFYNFDKNFRPLFINKVNIKKFILLTKKFSLEILIIFFIHAMERLKNIILPICSEMKKSQVKGMVLIFDLKNNGALSLLKNEVKKHFKPMIQIAQDNFPETIEKIYIINAPKLFSMFWAIVKLWLTQRTKNKVSLSNDGKIKELLELVHEEYLPVFMGGKCLKGINDAPGPWKFEVDKSIKESRFCMEDKSIVKKWYGE